jgi:hypothetical protein
MDANDLSRFVAGKYEYIFGSVTFTGNGLDRPRRRGPDVLASARHSTAQSRVGVLVHSKLLPLRALAVKGRNRSRRITSATCRLSRPVV